MIGSHLLYSSLIFGKNISLFLFYTINDILHNITIPNDRVTFECRSPMTMLRYNKPFQGHRLTYVKATLTNIGLLSAV